MAVAGTQITIRLTIEDPVPGVAYSLQDGDGAPVGAVTAVDAPLSFDASVRVDEGPKGPRFLGPFVRREGPERRFIYIAIGQQAGDAGSVWSRRVKVDIHTLAPELLAAALAGRVIEARLPGRDRRDGGPACATVRPLSWSVTRQSGIQTPLHTGGRRAYRAAPQRGRGRCRTWCR